MSKISLYIMSALYAAAGLYHFIQPKFYRRIMPPYLPLHNELIAITGCFEILFALLLLHSSTRRIGAWGIIVLLIAVYPANIQMTIDYYRENNPLLWLSILRLPLQFVLMWWAYGFTKPADAK